MRADPMLSHSEIAALPLSQQLSIHGGGVSLHLGIIARHLWQATVSFPPLIENCLSCLQILSKALWGFLWNQGLGQLKKERKT